MTEDEIKVNAAGQILQLIAHYAVNPDELQRRLEYARERLGGNASGGTSGEATRGSARSDKD